MEQVKLKRVLRERNISAYRLAKECHIATCDIYQALNGKKPMFPRWKKSIANYLHIDEEQLFEECEDDAKNVAN